MKTEAEKEVILHEEEKAAMEAEERKLREVRAKVVVFPFYIW